MSSIEDKINNILSSPKDMEKIMNLARSLSSNLNSEEGSSDPPEPETESAQPSVLGGIDPKMLGMLGKLMGEYNKESDKGAILNAIKPFLKEDRRDRIDKAAQIARLAHIAKIAFSEHGGDSDV